MRFRIPSVAYTEPEMSWAGNTEEECRAQGIKFGKAMFPWAAEAFEGHCTDLPPTKRK